VHFWSLLQRGHVLGINKTTTKDDLALILAPIALGALEFLSPQQAAEYLRQI